MGSIDLICNMADFDKAKLEYLTDLYYNPDSGVAYTTPNKLYDFVRKQKKLFFTKLEIIEFLKSQNVYTKNVKKNRAKSFARTHSPFSGYRMDVDTGFMVEPGLKTYRFLIGVDNFDRRMFAAPVRTLKFDSVKKAFDKLFATLGTPMHIRSDQGSEYKNSAIQAYFRDKNIISSFSTSRKEKANFAEAGILHLKRIMSRLIQSSNNTKSWLNVLPKALEMYNSTVSKAHNMSPNDAALQKNRTKVRQYVNNKALKRHGEPLDKYDFDIGDSVRMLLAKGALGKSHKPAFSDAIYTVTKRARKDNVNLYKIVDLDNKPVHGSFKRHELLNVNTGVPKAFIIKKLLSQTRTINGIKHRLVEWTNYKTHSFVPINKLKTYSSKHIKK